MSDRNWLVEKGKIQPGYLPPHRPAELDPIEDCACGHPMVVHLDFGCQMCGCGDLTDEIGWLRR